MPPKSMKCAFSKGVARCLINQNRDRINALRRTGALINHFFSAIVPYYKVRICIEEIHTCQLPR